MPHNTPTLTWDTPWDLAFIGPPPPGLLDALQAWLPEQRWFLTKDTGPFELSFDLAMRFAVGDQSVWLLIVRIIRSGHCDVLYQLPLVLVETPHSTTAVIARWENRYLVDAWTSPQFADEILRRLRDPDSSGRPLQFWHEATFDITTPAPATIPTHEQSNSTVQYGNRYFLKAFRLITPGTHPEEEMGRYLTNANFPHCILLRGGLRLLQYNQPATLAVLSDYVQTHGSLWDHLLNQFRNRAYQLEALARESVDGRSEATHLGGITAHFHATLARPTPDAAFQPEPFTAFDSQHLLDRTAARLTHVAILLAEHHPLTSEDQDHIRFILTHHSTALDHVTSQNHHGTLGLRTRIHGDYHLGQILVSDKLYISDFEGEPLRPLDERRAKDSPLRDVAGMRRSFDYLKATAPQERGADIDTLKHDFTTAYFTAAAEHPGLLPADERDREALLQLYELEKTLYEVEYELRARPAWLHIPLAALAEQLRTMANRN